MITIFLPTLRNENGIKKEQFIHSIFSVLVDGDIDALFLWNLPARDAQEESPLERFAV